MEPLPSGNEEKAKLAVLAGDILQDTQKLVEKQVALAKLQLFEDWGAFKPVALWMGAAVVALSSAGLLFSLTIVFLIHEVSQQPLAYCFGETVLLFAAIGWFGVKVAQAKAKELSFVNE